MPMAMVSMLMRDDGVDEKEPTRGGGGDKEAEYEEKNKHTDQSLSFSFEFLPLPHPDTLAHSAHALAACTRNSHRPALSFSNLICSSARFQFFFLIRMHMRPFNSCPFTLLSLPALRFAPAPINRGPINDLLHHSIYLHGISLHIT